MTCVAKSRFTCKSGRIRGSRKNCSRRYWSEKRNEVTGKNNKGTNIYSFKGKQKLSSRLYTLQVSYLRCSMMKQLFDCLKVGRLPPDQYKKLSSFNAVSYSDENSNARFKT